MKKLILAAKRPESFSASVLSMRKYLVFVFLLAVIGNVFFTHQAHATFFAARGETKIISGTDRVLKDSKGNPLQASKTNPLDQLYVYPSDTVGWKASVWNGGDLGHTTTVNVGNIYPDGTESGVKPKSGPTPPYVMTIPNVVYADRLGEEFNIILGASAFDYHYGYTQSDQDWYPAGVLMSSVRAVNPGDKFCQFDQVIVAGYNIIPYGGSYPGAPGFEYGPVGFEGNGACATIAFNYNLTPTISIGTPTGGSSTTPVTPVVSQGGLTPGSTATYSQPTQWQISQFQIPIGENPPDVTQNTQDPCTYFQKTLVAKSCVIPKSSDSGATSRTKADTIFNTDGTIYGAKSPAGDTFSSSVVSPASIIAGYKVCYALSVNTYQPYQSSPNWRNSKVVCASTSVPKNPKVQVLGDDVRVGKSIDTSLSSATVSGLAKTFGSWGEYASFSVGKNTGFATAFGLKDGSSSSTQSDWSELTFANAVGQYGQFSTSVNSAGATQVTPFFTQQLDPKASNITNGDISTLATSKTPYKASSLTIQGAGGGDITIAKGKTIIIVASGTVEIKSNIHYTSDPLSSLSDIPQVIIVAHDIKIDQNVSNVDAWLVADSSSGTIDTCSDATLPLTSSVCKTPLQVNGPVVTNQLYLKRTAGSDAADPGAPAETFENSGSAYLWAYNYTQNDLGLQTTNQIELPPRY
jgi:hypothetical protein